MDQEKTQKDEEEREIRHMHPSPNSQTGSGIPGRAHLTAHLFFHSAFVFLPPPLLHTIKFDTTSSVLWALIWCSDFSCIVPNEKLLQATNIKDKSE